MTKALYFTDFDFAQMNSGEVEFVKFSTNISTDTYFDVVIVDAKCEKELRSNKDKLQQNIYKIIVINSEDEISQASEHNDAWILSDKIDNIQKLIKVAKERLRISKELHQSKRMLSQLKANINITDKSCDLILLNLKKATSQIKNIFEAQTGEMKTIRTEIKTLISHLNDEINPPTNEVLMSAASQTEEILARTDDVIGAMHGFIRILQCEDRLSQMLAGIKNLLNLEDEMMEEFGIHISKEEISQLSSSLEALFSLPEQRDIAMGATDLEKMISCGDITESVPEEIELF